MCSGGWLFRPPPTRTGVLSEFGRSSLEPRLRERLVPAPRVGVVDCCDESLEFAQIHSGLGGEQPHLDVELFEAAVESGTESRLISAASCGSDVGSSGSVVQEFAK